MLEGAIAVWFREVRAGILERLLHYGSRVPTGVELGFHLCYGDEEHGHFCEPPDAGNLVDGGERARRRPRAPARLDPHAGARARAPTTRYFAPLGDLHLRPETELYLGLLHSDDGSGGGRERIAAARRYVNGFGVATECGWGRGEAEDVGLLLELHRELSKPVPG